MFKTIRYEKQILIVLLWSVLIFIGYNVLTAEAKESDDKKVCEDYNGEWKSIGGGDRGCTFENDDDAERYGFRPGFSLDSTGGDAEYGIEDLVTYDDEGNKIYPNTDTDSSKQQQEEKAAQEDAICDDEDADTTDIKLCMSDKREQQMKNIEKACDKAGLKLNNQGECDAKGDEDNADKFQEELDQIEKENDEPK